MKKAIIILILLLLVIPSTNVLAIETFEYTNSYYGFGLSFNVDYFDYMLTEANYVIVMPPEGVYISAMGSELLEPSTDLLAEHAAIITMYAPSATIISQEQSSLAGVYAAYTEYSILDEATTDTYIFSSYYAIYDGNSYMFEMYTTEDTQAQYAQEMADILDSFYFSGAASTVEGSDDRFADPATYGEDMGDGTYGWTDFTYEYYIEFPSVYATEMVDFGFGISLEDNSKPILVTVAMDASAAYPGVEYSELNIDTDYFPLRDIMATQSENYSNVYNNYIQLLVEQSKISDASASHLVFTYTDDALGIDYLVNSFMTVHNGIYYYLEAFAIVDEYDSKITEMEDMFSSFQILSGLAATPVKLQTYDELLALATPIEEPADDTEVTTDDLQVSDDVANSDETTSVDTEENKSSNLGLYIGIGAGVVIVAGILIFFLVIKKKDKKEDNTESDEVE